MVGVAHVWNSTANDATETYVSRLAVVPEQRGRGLAQALLVAAFAAGRERGATSSSLSTDSRTGALGLYERVGMRPDSTWLHRAVALTGPTDG
ncbi:GNAT family N-acetyltransferase [Nocardioides humi]|uniref:GNAT family N-acetyltransferase n=1 Tax=Nocardioides humi TaxID=449461 RepID=UPI001FEBB261|nr:GNAT family N-acetyltransferase [Nocardioides humi]